jgi:streptogramin lyase
MNLPHEIRFDSAGDLYIVDMQNHAIRKVELATMQITTFAGTGNPGYSGDGRPAIEAQFKQPHSIQFGPEGDLYVCDIGNHVIRRIDMKTHIISTYAGTGLPGPTPDGAPIAGTPLKGPRSIDFDSQGDLWLATREGNQVFRIDRNQRRYQHIAGTGQNGLEGDGGPAKLAKLNGPKGIALDNQGGVWLADTESHCVRRIDTHTGQIERIAGTGVQGDGIQGESIEEHGPLGDPLMCRLARLHGIFVDRDGSILIADSQAHRIRRLYREK